MPKLKKGGFIELKERLFGCRSFIVKETNDLRIEVQSWQGKIRISTSINSPYTMCFLIDLNRNDAESFVNLLLKSIEELPDGKTHSKS